MVCFQFFGQSKQVSVLLHPPLGVPSLGVAAVQIDGIHETY